MTPPAERAALLARVRIAVEDKYESLDRSDVRALCAALSVAEAELAEARGGRMALLESLGFFLQTVPTTTMHVVRTDEKSVTDVEMINKDLLRDWLWVKEYGAKAALGADAEREG